MRIAIVSDAWSPQINGVVTTLRTTVALMRARGHQVEVFAPDRFRTIPCPTYPQIRLAILPGRTMARLLDAFAPQAVHIATEGPVGIAGRSWCLRRKQAFTTSYHTKFPEYIQVRTGLPLGPLYGIMRRFHAPAARTFVATATMQRELGARGFRNLALWSRGVDTANFSPLDPMRLDLPGPIFVYMGRVAIEKNIRAFLDLDLPGSKLVIGDGPDLAGLRTAYPAAHFVGMRHGRDLARHIAAGQVFVFPSRTDTFGLAMIEGMACGLPVAAYPVPGPLDVVVPGVSGILHDDLRAACLAALTLDPAAARAHALTYTWDRATDQFLANLVPCGTVATVAAANESAAPMRVAGQLDNA